MAVTQQQTVFTFTAGGSATVYPFDCRVLAADDIVVTVDGVTKTRGADYNVNGVGDEDGGDVVFVSAPAAGSKVKIRRATRLQRLTDYQTAGDFIALVVNSDFDRLVMAMQDLQAGAIEVYNSVRVPAGEQIAALPAAAARAGRILGWDSAGNPALLSPSTAPLGVIGSSSQGEPVSVGDVLVTPCDLAVAMGPNQNSSSGALGLPYAGQGGAGDLFLMSHLGQGPGGAIQGRVAMDTSPKAAGVLGFYGGTGYQAGSYAVTFDTAGYYAFLGDGPSLFRGSGTDTILATTQNAASGTAVQGRLNAGDVVRGVAVLGFNDNVLGIKAGLWTQSLDATNVWAFYSAAGRCSINNTDVGDAFKSTNTGVGTAVSGTQHGGATGVLGFYDGTISAAVYGNDGGSSANYAAYFAGKGFVGSAWTVSDARLKRNFVELTGPYALELVDRIHVVEYDKLAIPTAAHPEERVLVHETGVLAQELREVLPDAVVDDGAYLAVNDRTVLFTLVRAVQELAAEVRRLRA